MARLHGPDTRRDWTPRRWVRILLPTVLLLVWFAAASFGGPTFGKLSSVSSNDQAAFLPASAESTKVNELQQKFTDSKEIPAIVLLVSDSTLSRGDLADAATLAKKLGEVKGVQAAEAPATTSVAGPIPSKDGKAVD
jgi:RND superfamily putative drug exporter